MIGVDVLENPEILKGYRSSNSNGFHDSVIIQT
jgi:hypothetical protein